MIEFQEVDTRFSMNRRVPGRPDWDAFKRAYKQHRYAPSYCEAYDDP